MEFSGCVLRAKIIGLWHGSSIFNFLRTFQNDFHNGHANLNPTGSKSTLSFSPYPLQHFLSSVDGCSDWSKVTLKVVLIKFLMEKSRVTHSQEEDQLEGSPRHVWTRVLFPAHCMKSHTALWRFFSSKAPIFRVHPTAIWAFFILDNQTYLDPHCSPCLYMQGLPVSHQEKSFSTT